MSKDTINTKKNACKKIIRKWLSALTSELLASQQEMRESVLEDMPHVYHTALSMQNALVEEGYGSSTARNAIQEMEKSEEIEKESCGFYIMNLRWKEPIAARVKSSLFATLLPVASTQLIEVTPHMAEILCTALNGCVNRNDKRFYVIAHNLLLLVDLQIPNGSNIAEKDFDLAALLEEQGIHLLDYDYDNRPLSGHGLSSILSSELDFHQAIDKKYGGAITKRNRKPTIKNKRAKEE